MQLLRLLAFVWFHPLNARGRLRAMGRVLRWQVSSRLLAGSIALPFVESSQLFARRGMAGATGNWYCGLHEVEEMGFVLHFLREEDMFLDVGANVGSYTKGAMKGGMRTRSTGFSTNNCHKTVQTPRWLFDESLFRRSLVHIGVISYGLYLWQELMLKSGLAFSHHAEVAILCAFIAAEFSYLLIEQPCLHLRLALEGKIERKPVVT
jgi:hypothetical protein